MILRLLTCTVHHLSTTHDNSLSRALEKARSINSEVATDYLKMKRTLESALVIATDMITGFLILCILARVCS